MADATLRLDSLHTARLLLRPVVLADLGVLAAMQVDPVVMEHYGDGRPLTPEQADETVTRYHVRCREHNYWAWAVTAVGSGEVLGQVTAGWDALDGRPAVALGYLLKRSAWGHGYGPEAVAAVVRHGLADLGWPRVWAAVSPSNARSMRLCEKAGLTFLRDGISPHGRPRRLYASRPLADPAAGVHTMEVKGMTRRVEVVPHDAGWAAAFDRAAEEAGTIFGPTCRSIHHVGSTAVPGIYAKPVIDMLAVVDDLSAVDALAARWDAVGFVARGELGIPGRRYFLRNDSAGARTHQIHAFQTGSAHVERHLAFRDYLRAHGTVARAYSDLKRRLAAAHPDDIEAYMDGKDEFIKTVEADAIGWVAGGRNRP